MNKTLPLLFLLILASFALFSQPTGNPFITKWDTNGGVRVVLPQNSSYSYNFTVDWGDGTVESKTSSSGVVHDYATSGVKTIKIYGEYPILNFPLNFSYTWELVEVVQWGDIQWASMNQMFRNCSNLVVSATDVPDLTNVTDMSKMFQSAGLGNVDFTGWDVSGVTNMSEMFNGAASFNGDLSDWDVSAVTDMNNMFYGASAFNSDLSAWDPISVNDMAYMFYGASSFSGDLSGWSTGSLSAMNHMFENATNFDSDLTSWDVSGIADMTSVFKNASSFNGDLSGWDVSGVTNMNSLFYGASSFNSDISGWDVSTVTDLQQIFYNATNFNGDISSWNVGAVANLYAAFRGASSFNQNIGGWDVSQVTNMYLMFYNASAFNQNIGSWNTGNVTNMASMFRGATAFNQEIGSWDVSSVMGFNNMFENASAFAGDLSSWDVSSGTSFSVMFQNAPGFNADISGWNTSSAVNMGNMFAGATSFNQDIGGWDVSNVTIAYFMFSGASSFDQDLSEWDVTSMTNMRNIFDNTSLSATNYDLILYSWSQLSGLQSNVRFGGVGLEYCEGADGRTTLVDTYNWNIEGDTEVCPDPFITKWHIEDDGTADYNQVRYYASGSYLGKFDIDWGDGQVSEDVVKEATHTYAADGDYLISVSGDYHTFQVVDNKGKKQLIEIVQWGDTQWWDLNGSFAECSNLEMTATDIPDLSIATSLNRAFYLCSNFNGDLSNWDVSNVANMDWTFAYSGFNGNISTWDVSGVTSMIATFSNNTVFNQDVSSWDVSNLANTSGLFEGASSFDQDLGAWDLSSVTTLGGIFKNAGLSTENYDNTLIGWAQNTGLQSNLSLGANGLTFCAGATARQALIDDFNWGILDGGESCDVITWNGASWSNGVGPSANDDVVIASGTYTAGFECNNLSIASGASILLTGTIEVNGDLTNDGTFEVTSGSSLITYDGNTIADNITFSRNTRYSDGKYSFVGVPVENGGSAITGDQLGNHVYSYDESASAIADDLARWIDASSDVLVPGRGYTQAEQQTIEFTGRPNDGSISYTASAVNDGFHLLSNPYPAAIDVNEFIDGNSEITGTLYVWDDNGSDTGRGSNSDYIVVTKTGATDNNGPDNESRWNGHIGSMQGFFIQMDGSAGSVQFAESMRVSGSNADGNFFRTSDEKAPIVRVNLTNANGLFKQAIVGWNDEVSNTEFSKGYDGLVFSTSSPNMIYSTKGEHALAIQTITYLKEQVPLVFNVSDPGIYKIELDFSEANGEFLYLRDNLTGEVIDASAGYEFSAQPGQNTDRFVLVRSKNVLGLMDEALKVYASNHTLYFTIEDGVKRDFKVLSLSGQQVYKLSLDHSAQVQMSVPAGVYFVSDGKQSFKVVLK